MIFVPQRVPGCGFKTPRVVGIRPVSGSLAEYDAQNTQPMGDTTDQEIA